MRLRCGNSVLCDNAALRRGELFEPVFKVGSFVKPTEMFDALSLPFQSHEISHPIWTKSGPKDREVRLQAE